MTEEQDKSLEELRRKQREQIHHRRAEEIHQRDLKKIEHKRKDELERKKARRSSGNLLTESVLDEIDLSADLTRDSMDELTADPSVKTVKKSKTRPVLIVIGVAIIAVVAANHFFSRGNDLPYYLDQIKPGMSHAEVLNIAPSILVIKEHAPMDANQGVSVFAILVEPGVRIASYLHLGYRGIFPKRDFAYIYFDDEDKVVGIDFSLEKGGWAPSWGSSKWNRMNRKENSGAKK